MCDDKRQEFILLSDTLGVSMLVDAINHRTARGRDRDDRARPVLTSATRPSMPLGADISGGHAGRAAAGHRHGDRRPAESRSPAPSSTSGIPTMTAITTCSSSTRSASSRCARRFRTDEDGRFWFWSIKPAAYPDSRMTDRSAKCSRRRAVIPGGRRMCIS